MPGDQPTDRAARSFAAGIMVAIINRTRVWKVPFSPSGPGRVRCVVQYRSFRNYDQPGLAVIWNEAFTGRGGVRLRHSSPLENYVFAKPYFDPDGLIVAVDNDQLVGFAHAGLGTNDAQTTLAPDSGVSCARGVRPSHSRRGIGTQLLERCERYLAGRGARTFYAGPMAPHNPFYFGLYGGSELSGFLASDPSAEPFMRRRGYEIHDTCLVFQRSLTEPINVPDVRFPRLRQRYEVRIVPRSGTGTWWQECTLGPIELVEFHLQDKSTNQTIGKTAVWEMDLFSWRWNQPAVGVIEIEVAPESRRQGLGKFLLAQ